MNACLTTGIVLLSCRYSLPLGDVLFGYDKEQWLADNFNKLNGKKHLILGNHDNPKFLAPYFKSIKLWSELPGMVLSHAPMHEQTLNESYRS